MINVNNWEREHTVGMTIEDLLKTNNYTFPGLVIKVNGRVIEDDERESTIISDGDDVKVIHICHGG
ncbi:MAG: sulfur carrier protein ThiS [Clostridiales bacterium]|nr:sulfur carrier protein ThiS [Clostridiales bacterium]